VSFVPEAKQKREVELELKLDEELGPGALGWELADDDGTQGGQHLSKMTG
jgi:hypothetical protein